MVRRSWRSTSVATASKRLAFFRDDAALVTDDHTHFGADFVRDSSGRVGWLRWGARIKPRLS
jgi:hypothetical protein